MLRLDLQSDAYWEEFLPGVRLRMKPVSTTLMMQARRAVAERRRAFDLPAPEKETDQEALSMEMTAAMAEVAILDWEGVGDADGKAVDVSPGWIAALMENFMFFQAFQEKYTAKGLMLESEKNGSAPLLNGSSAGARDTAKGVKKPAGTARRASTGRRPRKPSRSGTS